MQVLIEENLDVGILTFDKYTKELNRLIYSNEIKIYILDYDLGENTSKNGYDIAREIRSDAHDWYSIIIICSIHNKKERMNYEAKTFSCHWRIDCYSLVTLLAIGGRRYECLAER